MSVLFLDGAKLGDTQMTIAVLTQNDKRDTHLEKIILLILILEHTAGSGHCRLLPCHLALQAAKGRNLDFLDAPLPLRATLP
jgi:hypothetical protein